MKNVGTLFTIGMLGLTAAFAHPDPFARKEVPWIGPAPVPTMEQVFWLQVAVSPDEPVELDLPAGVEQVDRTRPGHDRGFTRFYLRAEGPIRQQPVVVRQAGKPPVELSLTVRSYREDIEHHIQGVSCIDPSVRKQRRTYYTDTMIDRARRNIEARPELAVPLGRAFVYDELDDEALFASLPSWNVPREVYSNFPCPNCGEEIFRHSGFRPWRRDEAHPFTLRCPDCGQRFPSNDYAAGDLTSGDYPDDGWGWDPGTGMRGDHAAWVAHYNHQHKWLAVGWHLHRMGLRYLLLDDEEAAHRAAILLARMAYVYPGMDMGWQQVGDTYLRRPGRLLVDGNWERNNTLVPAVRTYDAVFDAIDGNERLVEFLNSKDPAIRATDDVKALIETYFIQVLGGDWIDRNTTGGNMGAREVNLIQYAVAAGMGELSDRWLEEAFTNAYNSGLDKGGFDDPIATNMRTREGPAWIAGIGYATAYTRQLGDIAEELGRVDSAKWRKRADLYNRTLYPKFYAEFETWLDFIVAGQFTPSWGDGAGPPGARYRDGLPQSRALRPSYEHAYKRWGTDRLARALYRLGPREPGLFDHDPWEQVKEHAERIGPEPPLESRAIDGFGFVLLESRPHAERIEERAGVSLRYGYSRGHHHQDNLDTQLFAKNIAMTPGLGYPTWSHPLGDTRHVAHHNTGMIDRSPQYRGPTARGTLELFAPAGEASFADVSASPAGFPSRVYRRAISLADAPGGNVYLLDILRLAGGTTRTYCIHGPPYEAFDSSVGFAPTGDDYFDVGPALHRTLKPNILHPQRANTSETVWVDWKHLNHPSQEWPGASASGIPIEWPKVEEPTHLRLSMLGAPDRSYYTARFGKPDVPPIRFFFAEEETEGGASEFVAIWQPYKREPFIRKIESLSVAGHDAAQDEFSPMAVRVHLEGGQVDTFIYTFDPGSPLQVDGDLHFQGSFGYWSEQDGALRALHLVNGSHLHRDGQGVIDAPPAYRAAIRNVDYAERLIELTEPLPDDAGIAGRMLFVQNEHRRSAYEIEEVLEDRRTLRLRHNAILFRSELLHIGEETLAVSTELEPPVEVSNGFPAGYYDGATLTGDDGQARYQVLAVEGTTLRLDRLPRQADFPALHGDGRRMFRIYDFGPGDRVTLYWNVFRTGINHKGHKAREEMKRSEGQL